MTYLTAIILERQDGNPRRIVTKKGSYDEVEEFIMEHMDNMVKCKTKCIETNTIDIQLSFN